MRVKCLTCGATLSLGPASDDDPNVQVELRAAEIAAMWRDCLDDTPYMTFPEVLGWLNAQDSEGTVVDAGYLARAIHDHDEEQGT